jgi:glycosyltransferase involved in cell wall biosynthesis
MASHDTAGGAEGESGNAPEVSIIIPCLNEEQNVPVLVEKLSFLLENYGLNGEILIVDDCSDDYTFREAYVLSQRHARVRALHKGLPRGIGRAIRYGIVHAKGRLAVVVMGDLVDPLAAIPDFRNKIVDEGHQLVLLSRYLDPADDEGIPGLYRFYHFWFRLFCRLLVGIRLTDITYAFRAFDLAWARSANLSSDGFEISPEITCKAWLGGAKIVELRGRQGRRFQGESKFLFSREGWGYATVLLNAIVCRFTGRWPAIGSQRSQPLEGEEARR